MSLLRWLPHRGQLPDLPADIPGTPVILLHGLMGSPGNFEVTARELIARNIPVVAPEYGQRGTVAVSQSLAEVARIIEPIIDASPRSQVDIVGHSLGGMLALRLAQQYPGKIRTVVGLGATFRGLPQPPNPLLRHGIRAVMGRGAVEIMTSTPFPVTVPKETRVVSVVSATDQVVPAASSELGDIISVSDTRHEYLPSLATEIISALDWTP
ncbi:alpha/beta fold hydrolase [Corynebacterium alimapuense]|uniref:Alpha/beta hydrolase n=1 Tax=Corynebacterium alimapuense TaxID=1576874 RepID=A0A3M8KBT7_9CORY|nr:alpha/beta fold hydrolase [Corynebacterium alimapuense]RNE49848.1 alpha/beta hydrolase [Corynebacterium alimapuense]